MTCEGVAVIRASGSIIGQRNDGRLAEMCEAKLLGKMIESLVEKGARKIVIDLKEVGEIDPVGIGELNSASRAVAVNRGELKLSNPHHVRGVLRCNLMETEIYGDEEAAVKSFVSWVPNWGRS
jgi:anti-anti-sigma regulatory factor